jgi:hypothetical protein
LGDIQNDTENTPTTVKMKGAVLQLAFAASLAAAQPHNHHAHHHQKREHSPVEGRDVATAVTYVPAYVTKYVIGDDDITPEDAEAGLDKGLYVVVGETTPTFTPPPPPPPPTSTTSPDGGVFVEKEPETTSSPPPPPPSSTAEAPAPSPEVSISSYDTGSSSGSGSGVDKEFPSGKIPCTEFPSDYGAIPVDWMDLGGYTGIQRTPNFNFGDSFISFIETAVKGYDEGYDGPAFYSYACPEGYVKSQWPEAQGNTGQSIGGLLCKDGVLELTRPDVKTLCTKGVGGVQIVNKMSSGTSICRTDYPGTENMCVPLDVKPGGSYDLANIESNSYYEWDGKATTLQYYLNQKGVGAEKGCRWNCDEDHDECGNWAPVIIGTGQSSDGITYLSIFPNKPTSTAKLNFNIEVTGDVTLKCTLKNGVFSGSSDGCTTGIPSGGTAKIIFTDA